MHTLMGLSLFILAQGPAEPAELPAGAIARLGSTHFRHPSPYGYAALSPDGKLLASSGNDGMRMWDVVTGKQLLFGPNTKTRGVGSVVFSPDGKLLASRGAKALALWDVAKREIRFELADGKSSYHAPAFSADGKYLAAYSDDGMRVWNVLTGKLDAEWGIRLVAWAFAGDGKTVITAERESPLRYREASSGKVTREIQRTDDHYWVGLLVLSPKNDLLAVVDGTTQRDDRKPPMYSRMHDFATGKERYRIASTWEEGFVSAFAFAPDGKTMVLVKRSLGRKGESNLEIRDVVGGKLLRTIPLPGTNYHSLSFSGDGKLFALAGNELTMRLFRYPDFTPYLPPVGHTKPVTAVAFAADGKRAYSSSEDGSLITWDLKTSQPMHSSPLELKYGGRPEIVHNLFATPDGKFIVAAVWGLPFDSDTRQGTIYVRQLPDGKLVHEIKPVSGGAALSPDGRTLAAGDGASVRVWDLATGKARHKFEGHTKDVSCVAFSPDGQIVASISNDGTVRLWHAAGGGPAGCFNLFSEDSRIFFTTPPTLTFTPDGRHLVSVVSRWSTAIEAWEIASGERVQLIKLDKQRTYWPTILSNGRTLLVSERRTGAQLFDLATGKLLPKPLDARVNALALAPDRRTLTTAGDDGFLLTWKTEALTAPAFEKAEWSAKDLARLWQDLGALYGKSAYAAHWDLVRGGDASVKFLGDQLRPAVGPDAALVTRRLAELDNADFKVRDQANMELEKWGKAVEFDVRAALAEKRPLEGRRRLEQVLATIDKLPEPPEALLTQRALAVLEAIGTGPARDLLQKMADGTPGSRVTVDAKGSLGRLRP